jgi:predicted 3-demethylubiquinone-9 3-methyltransferase (glyoxalase superfamily)
MANLTELQKEEQIKGSTFHKITPCLWYDGTAAEAAGFYCSVFKNSGIITESPMVVTFELNGVEFMGLNGGPQFKFNESVSFVVNCDTQAEIDYYWNRLTEGGEESMCGWLKDKYGVSWQIVPAELTQIMSEPAKAERVIKAFMNMRKLDIEMLKNA